MEIITIRKAKKFPWIQDVANYLCQVETEIVEGTPPITIEYWNEVKDEFVTDLLLVCAYAVRRKGLLKNNRDIEIGEYYHISKNFTNLANFFMKCVEERTGTEGFNLYGLVEGNLSKGTLSSRFWELMSKEVSGLGQQGSFLVNTRTRSGTNYHMGTYQHTGPIISYEDISTEWERNERVTLLNFLDEQYGYIKNEVVSNVYDMIIRGEDVEYPELEHLLEGFFAPYFQRRTFYRFSNDRTRDAFYFNKITKDLYKFCNAL